MSYQSPIEVFQTQMQSQIEGEIYKAVMRVGVNIDKYELLKALQYDRDQYQKGYADRDSEIVRCKNCKNAKIIPWLDNAIICKKHSYTGVTPDDFYCADGVPKD